MDIVLKTKKQLPFLHTRWYRSVDYVIMNNVGTIYVYSNFNSILTTVFTKKTNTENSKVNLGKLLYWIFND